MKTITTFTIVFNEPMNMTSGSCHISDWDSEMMASFGNPSAEMSVTWVDSFTFVITLTNPLPPRSGFDMDLWAEIA